MSFRKKIHLCFTDCALLFYGFAWFTFSAIQGSSVSVLRTEDPSKPSRFVTSDSTRHPIFTAETHNFPTGTIFPLLFSSSSMFLWLVKCNTFNRCWSCFLQFVLEIYEIQSIDVDSFNSNVNFLIYFWNKLTMEFLFLHFFWCWLLIYFWN